MRQRAYADNGENCVKDTAFQLTKREMKAQIGSAKLWVALLATSAVLTVISPFAGEPQLNFVMALLYWFSSHFNVRMPS